MSEERGTPMARNAAAWVRGTLMTLGRRRDRLLVFDGVVDTLKIGGNVLVAGGTGSGKTTLLNAFIAEFDDYDRILVIEDTLELKVDHPNTARLEASASREGLDATAMVKHATRRVEGDPPAVATGPVTVFPADVLVRNPGLEARAELRARRPAVEAGRTQRADFKQAIADVGVPYPEGFDRRTETGIVLMRLVHEERKAHGEDLPEEGRDRDAFYLKTRLAAVAAADRLGVAATFVDDVGPDRKQAFRDIAASGDAPWRSDVRELAGQVVDRVFQARECRGRDHDR